MNDIEYVYRQDIREKAVTARSAKKTPKSHSRRVSLPDDGLSKKEREKMNGPVHSVKLSEPIAWERFKELPESMQREYVQNILSKYKVGPKALARMFGISGPYCGSFLHKLGFAFPERASREETERFLAAYSASADKKKKSLEIQTEVQRLAVTFTGAFSPEVIAAYFAPYFAQGQTVSVTLEVTAV